MDVKKIDKYRQELKSFCVATGFLVAIMVALMCLVGYLTGLLIWWGIHGA
tara:strand:- start:1000 stop:1149 length:150 start_codon:yes stop_codon:yes gene_type:complete